MARSKASLVFAVAAVVAAACDQAPETTSPDRNAAVVPVDQATDPAVVSQRISGFGGMYLDAAGRPTVYLTDLAEAPMARAALSRFAEEYGSSESEIQFVKARHSIQRLNGWYERTWPEVLELQGAVFTDVDEANNRVLFGVERAGLATAVAAIMRAHGVPQDAYAVEVVEPIVPAATLRDVVNPKVGGLQIHFGNYLCTLGFNVTQNSQAHFVTNSHCTNTQGGVEGTVYYQPTSTLSGAIADEVKDPTYQKGNGQTCPRGKKCRRSDSSLARYRSGVTSDLGGIATTSGSNLTISSTVRIATESTLTNFPTGAGSTATKTGRTTGTSTGTITNTCVNTAVSGSQIVQLCQTFVSAAVGAGDSGSPVRNGTTLLGILWGGSSSGNQFVFSPLASVKQELGTFTAH